MDVPVVPIRNSSKPRADSLTVKPVSSNQRLRNSSKSNDEVATASVTLSPELNKSNDGLSGSSKPSSAQKILIAIETPLDDGTDAQEEAPKSSSGHLALGDSVATTKGRGSSPNGIGLPRRNSSDHGKKGAGRLKSHKSTGNLLFETDVDRVAQLIEELSLLLPGFSELWTNAPESVQQDVLHTLSLKLAIQRITGAAFDDSIVSERGASSSSGKKERSSHRHASESARDPRPSTHARSGSTGGPVRDREGREREIAKNKRDSGDTPTSSDPRQPKSAVLRARYSQSYDKTTPLPILLEREREKDSQGYLKEPLSPTSSSKESHSGTNTPPQQTEVSATSSSSSFAQHASVASAINSSSSNLSLNLTALPVLHAADPQVSHHAKEVRKRLSGMQRLSGGPMLGQTMADNHVVESTAICKRRELKNYKGHKSFVMIDPPVLFRRTNEKSLPQSTAQVLNVLKSVHDSCNELVFIVHSNVRELERANKALICNEPVDYQVEYNRSTICEVVGSFGVAIQILIQEMGIEKRDNKMMERVRRELDGLKKRGDASELDAKTLKVGLFRNLLIKQLQSRLIWLGNNILCATSQIATDCVELAAIGEKDFSTVLHLFCLFSSVAKLLSKVLDDYETIGALFNYEGEKVDAKAKKEEMERRKARIKTIWDLNQSDTQGNIYRASPIDELIVRGTCMQSVDIYYIDTLVITSLSLGEPPVAFLELLLERFFPPANKFPKDVESQFRLKALKLLRVYLTKNYFHIDPQLQFTLRTFVETKLPRAISNQAHIDSIKDKLNVKDNFDLAAEDKKLVPLLIFTDTRPFDIQQFFEQDVAEQLTLLDLEIFRKIQHFELLGQAWSKPKLQTLAINVTELITRPNKISFWVATCILLQQKLKDRVKTVTSFIQIAQKLDELKSYNTMMGVLAGLNSSAISRLHQTNAQIDKRVKTIFEELNAKVNPEKAFKNLRDIMMFCGRPCLPYIGIYLTDLTFIDEGNADTVNVDGVDVPNFPKQQMVSQAINNLTQFQQNIVGEFNLSIKFPLHSFLSELPAMSENDLWEMSQEREPRVQQS